MRFLDNVVDATEYFFEENARAQLGTRRTGLGTMGLADALIKLHVPYGSDESVPVIERIYRTIRDAAYDASADLAAEKGPFPMFDREKYLQGRFIKRLPDAGPGEDRRARDAQRRAAHPGPHRHHLAAGRRLLRDRAGVRLRHGARATAPASTSSTTPCCRSGRTPTPRPPAESVPGWFVSANDLTPEEHVRVQAKVQHYTDSSISKTVNAPNDHTVEQVQELYIKAYDYGCKGVTYFRDGCREGVLSHIESKAPAPAQAPERWRAPELAAAEAEAHAAPEAVQLGLSLGRHARAGAAPQAPPARGRGHHLPHADAPGDDVHHHHPQRRAGSPSRSSSRWARPGRTRAAVTEALGRLISLVLRLPSPLSGEAACRRWWTSSPGSAAGASSASGPTACAPCRTPWPRCWRTTWGAAEARRRGAETRRRQRRAPAPASAAETPQRRLKADLCPECGDATLVFQEGCEKCMSCGFAAC